MSRRPATPIWANRLVRSLAGQWGTDGDPTVLRVMGQLVPLARPAPTQPVASRRHTAAV